MKTKTKFLVHEKGDVYAYFPDDFADHFNNRQSYSHIGQHSACSPDYAAESRPATIQEYSDLKTELESVGYDLEII